MVDVPLPLLSAPDSNVQAAGGRLINCFPEKLPPDAGKPYKYRRATGLSSFGTSAQTGFRGAKLVGSTLYTVIGTKVVTFTSSGGAGTVLTGTLNGSDQVFIASNNKASPNVVFVSPSGGAYYINGGGAVASYPDADVGSPNSVTFLKGFFIFTYGTAAMINSDVNSTAITATNTATAESKPDTLYCTKVLGNGQLLAVGSSSMEVWGGQNDTGFVFSYIATIGRGVVGPYAICGDEDGWGKGIFLVGDDWRVSQLNGYTPSPISTPAVDRAIENEATKSSIKCWCYVAKGVGWVVVQGTDWTWEYNTSLQTWHERQSYGATTWRAMPATKAFDKWLCGDSDSGNILYLDPAAEDELGDPLNMRIETGPLGAFPNVVRVNGIELYCTKGAGLATGTDPTQTDPSVGVQMSRDGGQTWGNQRLLKVGRQSETIQRVRGAIWGQAEVQGVRWRLDFSSNVPFSFMGAEMDFDKLN